MVEVSDVNEENIYIAHIIPKWWLIRVQCRKMLIGIIIETQDRIISVYCHDLHIPMNYCRYIAWVRPAIR